MNITQRQSFLAICGLVIVGALLFSAFALLNGVMTSAAIGAGGAMLASLVLVAYLRGWQYAPHVLVILLAPLTVYSTQDAETVFRTSTLIAPSLALVLLSPRWVVGMAIATTLLMGMRVGWSGPYVDPINLMGVAFIVGVMLLARAILNTTMRQSEEARQRAEESQAVAEAQAAALAEANAAQQAQLEEQRRLLALVTTLETPAVSLADGVLFAPVVGHLDTRRSAALTSRLLEAAYDGRAHHVIIDISGVATVDTAVAKTLLDTARALRLLGCRVTLSGISAEVALTLTRQGVGLDDIITVRSPQEALA